MSFNPALRAFGINGVIDEIAPFGLGHINDSYRVSSEGKQYFLQKLNTEVFTHFEHIEHNLRLLLENDPSIFVSHFMAQGRYHWSDGEGVWRLTAFEEDYYSPQMTGDAGEMKAVAGGFGRFVANTALLEASRFKEPIYRFHDLVLRWDQFREALQLNSHGRAKKVEAMINQVQELYLPIATEKRELVEAGLPKRVCHNDCKVNNCLLSNTDNTFGFVVDLDTVGPGYVLYDFGDLLRTCLVAVPENEKEVSAINVDKIAFETLARGFLSECSAVLSRAEKNSLVFGAIYMTFMMGMRFLADYLAGDSYYKVSHTEENLVRARNQFIILDQLMARRAEFEDFIKRHTNE